MRRYIVLRCIFVTRPRSRPRPLADAVVQIRRGLGPSVVLVGVGGGLIGAVYVGSLHLLQRLLDPGHHGPVAQLAILVAVGIGLAGALGATDRKSVV